MSIIFFQLSAILVFALILTFLVKKLGQPPVVSYIITGIIVGPAFLGLVRMTDAITAFGQIGVALLLFIVGLGLKPETIKEMGRVVIITAIGQIIFTTIFGLAIAASLGYNAPEAMYMALAFTFSSTIIVFQLLYAKEEQDTLYGRVAIGFLLVQDFVALITFLFVTSASASGVNLLSLIGLLSAKIIIVGLVIYLLSRKLISRIDTVFARHREVLFIFALAAVFSLAALFKLLGFSLELGALAAGVILSSSPYQREVAARLSALRDFFLIMFFVVLGASVSIEVMIAAWPTILIFSIFILIGNPLIVIILMRRLGYTLATSFFAGLTVAQISEFSLILLALGATLGHIRNELVGIGTIIGLVTIFVSTYFIMYNRQIFRRLEPLLRKLFGPDIDQPATMIKKNYHSLLFGCHRLGTGLAEVLNEMEMSCLIIDHNPDTIRKLKLSNKPCVFGSADNINFLETLPTRECRSVISTIPDVDVNLVMIEFVRRLNPQTIILCVANHQSHAVSLYSAGATYVIVPPYLGRRYIIKLLREYGTDFEGYQREREIHEREFYYN